MDVSLYVKMLYYIFVYKTEHLSNIGKEEDRRNLKKFIKEKTALNPRINILSTQKNVKQIINLIP